MTSSSSSSAVSSNEAATGNSSPVGVERFDSASNRSTMVPAPPLTNKEVRSDPIVSSTSNSSIERLSLLVHAVSQVSGNATEELLQGNSESETPSPDEVERGSSESVPEDREKEKTEETHKRESTIQTEEQHQSQNEPQEKEKSKTSSKTAASSATSKANRGQLTTAKRMTLPHILMMVLAHKDYSDTIRFVGDGRAFKIFNEDSFKSNLLEQYFGDTDFAAFRRKLSRWGFAQINRPDHPDDGAYHHPHFRRDDVDAWRKMKLLPAGRQQQHQNEPQDGDVARSPSPHHRLTPPGSPILRNRSRNGPLLLSSSASSSSHSRAEKSLRWNDHVDVRSVLREEDFDRPAGKSPRPAKKLKVGGLFTEKAASILAQQKLQRAEANLKGSASLSMPPPPLVAPSSKRRRFSLETMGTLDEKSIIGAAVDALMRDPRQASSVPSSPALSRATLSNHALSGLARSSPHPAYPLSGGVAADRRWELENRNIAAMSPPLQTAFAGIPTVGAAGPVMAPPLTASPSALFLQRQRLQHELQLREQQTFAVASPSPSSLGSAGNLTQLLKQQHMALMQQGAAGSGSAVPLEFSGPAPSLNSRTGL